MICIHDYFGSCLIEFISKKKKKKGINTDKADKTSMHYCYVLHFSHCLLPLFVFVSFQS